MMARFLNFLHESPAIMGFINEVGEREMSFEEESVKIASYSSRFPQLKEYFEIKDISAVNRIGGDVAANALEFRNEEEQMQKVPWSQSLRLAILDHLNIMEIDVGLLIDAIETYRFDLKVDQLVAIVRALDILGAERRLTEYEVSLYIKLKTGKADEEEYVGGLRDVIEWAKRRRDRLPVSFSDHIVEKCQNCSIPYVVGKVGSQKLMEYCLENYPSIFKDSKNGLFTGLCEYEHLSAAQWLYNQGELDIRWCSVAFQRSCANGYLSVAQWLYSIGHVTIRANGNDAFQKACRNGHILVAQWLHSLDILNLPTDNNNNNNNNDSVLLIDIFVETCCAGQLAVAQWLYSVENVNIHTDDDLTFRSVCRRDHFLVAQWLYSLGGVNIGARNQQAFRYACYFGHLSIAQWLYSLTPVDDATRCKAFHWACSQSHLQTAQWLYSLGDINVHVLDDSIFRRVCESGCLPLAQWLYSLGGISSEVLLRCMEYDRNPQLQSWIQSIVIH
jgi:hypothetical protein